ncbi:hypothetical protein [Thiocystis violacea]|uniref:hypothetical protein n=1 Tax=Thiocystis violacea TaxID=13725 RepID=UPI001906911B|nr:hypothetical protein [Thiocystis violacea]MBK1717152.1 hypothetical protein [Thiocystis violacea]
MKTRHGLRRLLIITLLLGLGGARADGALVVVMSGASGVDSLTREEVINIFLGRFRQLPSGQAALPVDQPEDPALLADFYQRLVNKKPAEIRAYWSRLVFSGKTAPPRQAKSHEEGLKWLSDNPGAVGYMRSDARPSQLKVVFTLGP